MKILHIYSDRKFIKAVEIYKNPLIENNIVFLGDKFSTSCNISFYPRNLKSYKAIAELSMSYDIVVFMSMTLQHALICNLLPKDIKVIWRFFGAELYPYLQRDILTVESQKFMKRNKIHKLFSNIKNKLLYGDTADRIFWRAVRRSNLFMCLSKDEYDFLQNKFCCLPKFLQVPHIYISHPKPCYNRSDNVIIGHSRNIDGNHIDILKAIKSSLYKDNYKYILFFSYSEYSKKYSQAVVELAESIPSAEIITGFLPLDEFNRIQSTSSALVINAIRQIGVGNIFSAIRNGMKVYLHPDSVMFNWYLNNGIKVFSSLDFVEDLNHNNLHLTREEIDANLKAYENLTLKFNVNDFQNKIFDIIK